MGEVLDRLMEFSDDALRYNGEFFEIAFGDNAINRDYSMGEVLDRLMEFSDDALDVTTES